MSKLIRSLKITDHAFTGLGATVEDATRDAIREYDIWAAKEMASVDEVEDPVERARMAGVMLPDEELWDAFHRVQRRPDGAVTHVCILRKVL
jgi:hypothetical protein